MSPEDTEHTSGCRGNQTVKGVCPLVKKVNVLGGQKGQNGLTVDEEFGGTRRTGLGGRVKGQRRGTLDTVESIARHCLMM